MKWIWPVALAATIVLESTRSRIAGPDIPNIDKVAHFAVYGLLATLTCRLGRGWRAPVLAVFAVSAFGVSDEWHQSFVPGRSSDILDWVADTLGAILAVSVYSCWPQYRRLMEISLHRNRRIEKPAPATPDSSP